MSNQLKVAQRRSESLCKLSPFRAVSALIQQKLDSHTEVSAILRLIALDPAMTAEMLVAANSPMNGFAARIHTVEDAATILGWEQTNRIVQAVISTDHRLNDGLASVIERSWAHSLASAFLAGELAPFFSIPEDRAYTLALMHDIGRLGMLSTATKQYLEVISLGCHSSAEFLGSEECTLGMNHCRAGLWLNRAWGLPIEFSETAACHHDPFPPANQPAVALVGLACRLAHVCGLAVEPCKSPGLAEAFSYAGPKLPPDLAGSWNQIRSRTYARLLEKTSAFYDFDGLQGAPGDVGPLHSLVRTHNHRRDS